MTSPFWTFAGETSKLHYLSTLAEFEAEVTRLLRLKGTRPIKTEWVHFIAEYYRNKDMLLFSADNCVSKYHFVEWALGTERGKLELFAATH